MVPAEGASGNRADRIEPEVLISSVAEDFLVGTGPVLEAALEG